MSSCALPTNTNTRAAQSCARDPPAAPAAMQPSRHANNGVNHTQTHHVHVHHPKALVDLKRRLPLSGRAPGLEPNPGSSPSEGGVLDGDDDGVASTGVTAKRRRVDTATPTAAAAAVAATTTTVTAPSVPVGHTHTTNVIMVTPHLFAALQQSMLQQRGNTAANTNNNGFPNGASSLQPPSVASVVESTPPPTQTTLPVSLPPLQPLAVGRARSSSIEVASPRHAADDMGLARVMHSPPQAGSPPRAAMARFARAAMPKVGDGLPRASRPLVLQKKATANNRQQDTTPATMPPPPLPHNPLASPPMFTFNPSVSGPSAVEMEAANTLRSLRMAPVARWQLEGVKAALFAPTVAGPTFVPCAAPTATAAPPTTTKTNTNTNTTTAAAAAAATPTVGTGVTVLRRRTTATATTTTTAATYIDPSDEDDSVPDEDDDDDYREGEDDQPWVPRRTQSRPSALRRGGGGGGGGVGRRTGAASAATGELHVPVVVHSTPVRSRKPRVTDGSPDYTATGFRVPPREALGSTKKPGPRPGRRALVLPPDAVPAAPVAVPRRRVAASPSKQRHDLRIRVAARGVVYIFGRAMSSRTLWWVGSDLVRFALLDRNVISPTFKFKLPSHKAVLSEAAQHPAVRDVVLRALDLESRLKKPTGTRARVKLDDTEEVMDAFKTFVEQQARLLGLVE